MPTTKRTVMVSWLTNFRNRKCPLIQSPLVFKIQKFTCVFARTLQIWCDINPEETMHNVLLISEITGATFCVCWSSVNLSSPQREIDRQTDRDRERQRGGGRRFRRTMILGIILYLQLSFWTDCIHFNYECTACVADGSPTCMYACACMLHFGVYVCAGIGVYVVEHCPCCLH